MIHEKTKEERYMMVFRYRDAHSLASWEYDGKLHSFGVGLVGTSIACLLSLRTDLEAIL